MRLEIKDLTRACAVSFYVSVIIKVRVRLCLEKLIGSSKDSTIAKNETNE